MIVEILGFKPINTENEVTIVYKTGRTGIYSPEKVEQVLVNVSEVAEIRILKSDK